MLMTSYNLSRFITICILLCRLTADSAKVGVCDICLATNNVACLDENHFSVCHDNRPSATIVPCPSNMVCTNDRQICRLTTDGFTPICYEQNCGTCDLDSVFTCLDRTTYAYCFESTTIYSESIRSCPVGYVCNTHSADICVPGETNQPSCLLEPTTTTTTDETTTVVTDTTPSPTPPWQSSTEAPRDPNVICRDIGKNGYFKSDDPTCREYIYCYLLSGQYLGWTYYCDGYFNAATGRCQKERPVDC